ncbi:MAG: hypothetical protein WC708_13385 [Lentisphaeria bacterium]
MRARAARAGRRWRRRLPALALFGALGVHVALYWLLTWRTPAVPLAAAEPVAPCWMLPPPSVAGGDPGGLRAWSQFEEPAALVLADPVHGFGALLAVPLPPPFSPAAQWEGRLPPPPPPAAFPDLRLVPAALPVAAALREDWRFDLPGGATSVAAPAAAPQAVVWRFADGVLLEGVADPPAAELAAALAGGAPRGPSRFAVMLEPESPGRLRLTESCGNPRLDRLALNRLAARLWEWEREALRRHARPLPDRFAGDNGYREAVEVEWRLAAAPEAGGGA